MNRLLQVSLSCFFVCFIFSGCVTAPEVSEHKNNSADPEVESEFSPLPVPEIKENTNKVEDFVHKSNEMAVPEPENKQIEPEEPLAVLLTDSEIEEEPIKEDSLEKEEIETPVVGNIQAQTETISEPVEFTAPQEKSISVKPPVMKNEQTARPIPHTQTIEKKQELEKKNTWHDLIYARVGDEVHYPVESSGWVFTGTDPDNNGIRFSRKKDSDDGHTVFVFKAERLGSYELIFSKYDLSAGTEEILSVPVHILTNEDFAAVLGTDTVGSSETVEGFFTNGEYGEIVNYFSNKEPQSPRETYILGVSQKETWDNSAAVFWLRRLLAEEDVYRRKALALLRDIALDTGNKALLFDTMRYPDFFDIEHSPDQLSLMGKAAYDSDKNNIGIQAYRLLINRFANYRQMDEILWFLANLLERPGIYRDLSEALRLYDMILDGYPTSRYYEKAEYRIRYLKQHYIHVN